MEPEGIEPCYKAENPQSIPTMQAPFCEKRSNAFASLFFFSYYSRKAMQVIN